VNAHATLTAIAQEAGVSVSTASRALSGRSHVRAEVRERILAIAQRLGYRPNLMARSLVTGRSQTFGLLLSDIRNPFFAEFARGAEDAARAAGYDVLLANTDLDPEKLMNAFRLMLNKQVDGLVMNTVAFLSRERVDELAGARLPIVLLNRPAARERRFSTVLADNERGGLLAGRYLMRLGHSRTAVLAGPGRHANLSARARAFLRAVEAAGGSARPVVAHGIYNAQGGYEMARGLIRDHPEITAVFATSDAIAFGAIRAFLEAGRRIPEDISLIGFDDVEMASVVHPPLTTVWQPKYELGVAAIEVLLRHARTPGLPSEHRSFDVRLVERQSCRSLRKQCEVISRPADRKEGSRQ
jgi:LacI family transcriptional regulator